MKTGDLFTIASASYSVLKNCEVARSEWHDDNDAYINYNVLHNYMESSTCWKHTNQMFVEPKLLKYIMKKV